MGKREIVVKARRTTHPVYRLDNHRWRELKRKHKAHSASQHAACWLAEYGMCLLDGVPIDYQARPGTARAYETDHAVPRAQRPDLMYVWANLRAAHSKCNRSRQAKDVGTPHVWVRPSW